MDLAFFLILSKVTKDQLGLWCYFCWKVLLAGKPHWARLLQKDVDSWGCSKEVERLPHDREFESSQLLDFFSHLHLIINASLWRRNATHFLVKYFQLFDCFYEKKMLIPLDENWMRPTWTKDAESTTLQKTLVCHQLAESAAAKSSLLPAEVFSSQFYQDFFIRTKMDFKMFLFLTLFLKKGAGSSFFILFFF